MPYFLNTSAECHDMLAAIGVESIEDLFALVPAELRLKRPLDIAPAMGELELSAHVGELAAQNIAASDAPCFLGGGAYDHFIPAVVDYVSSRSEFYTAYTPYQPEASQGSLQALFEYQTLIARLTGMDVANSSLYDGGSATAEAVLMALSVTGRLDKVVVAESVHPEYRQVVATYLANLGTRIVTVPAADGAADPAAMAAAIDDATGCVLVQHPNFFGCLEDVKALAEAAHARGAALVQVFDPISLGILKNPGDLGADIAVAEGQCLGNPLAYGGPYLGILTCRERFLRRLPGRLVGQTVDRRGNRCWVLTLQTREQHIRREKATSNICTNQALFALRASVYLALMGPQGLREVAELCLNKARYCQDRFAATGRAVPAFGRPTFKEFVVRLQGRTPEEFVQHAVESDGILAGVPLGRWYPQYADCLLVAVTEKRTRVEIERLAKVLATTPFPFGERVAAQPPGEGRLR